MPNKISKHSKTFAWLFSIAFLGTFLAFFIAWKMDNSEPIFFEDSGYETVTYSPRAKQQANEESQIIVDTSDWEEYYNEKYGLAFKHDPDWKVRSLTNKDGYYVIEIDPGIKYDNFRVYISTDDYFALSGVPTQKITVAGREALDLEGQVLGIMDNSTYFTFDMGASLSLKPYFQALVKTVEFR